MAGKETLKAGCKIAKTVLSRNRREAHVRVISLYRAYYRYIPYLVRDFDIPKTEEDCRAKLREYFYKNACITDLRMIDILVIKGFIEFKETTQQWQQKGHIMAHWHPTYEPKPCDFLGKFLANLH